MAVDPRNFLLNTDYEMDKIVYFTSGSIAQNDNARTIAHGLSFTPLIFGICSFNSDFTDCRSIPYLYQTQATTVSFEAKANGSNIVVEHLDFDSPSRPMYYRLYAFEPSDSHANVPATSNNASSLY